MKCDGCNGTGRMNNLQKVNGVWESIIAPCDECNATGSIEDLPKPVVCPFCRNETIIIGWTDSERDGGQRQWATGIACECGEMFTITQYTGEASDG